MDTVTAVHRGALCKRHTVSGYDSLTAKHYSVAHYEIHDQFGTLLGQGASAVAAWKDAGANILAEALTK